MWRFQTVFNYLCPHLHSLQGAREESLHLLRRFYKVRAHRNHTLLCPSWENNYMSLGYPHAIYWGWASTVTRSRYPPRYQYWAYQRVVVRDSMWSIASHTVWTNIAQTWLLPSQNARKNKSCKRMVRFRLSALSDLPIFSTVVFPCFIFKFYWPTCLLASVQVARSWFNFQTFFLHYILTS